MTQISFSSLEEFKAWKEKVEEHSMSYYSKRGSTKNTKTSSYLYYHCQRDGHSRPHERKGNEKRKTARRNRKGVIKRDEFCPARMTCKVNRSGAVNVTYVHTNTHALHFKDTEHQPIPKTVLQSIKEKLLLGASVHYVLRDLREGKDTLNNRKLKANDLRRKHAISKRVLRDIQRRLENNKGRVHSNDATSLAFTIAMLSNSPSDSPMFNPILLYKPQGHDFEIPPPNLGDYKIDEKFIEKVFLLGFQTEEQLAMFLSMLIKLFV